MRTGWGWTLGCLLAAACTNSGLTDPPQQEVSLGPPLLLQIGNADTSYNEGSSIELSGGVARLIIQGTVSLPGPSYTVEPSGRRLGLNVVITLAGVVVPGGQPSTDLSGRTLRVEWELPAGTYRVLVQDDLQQLIERVIEVE